MAPAPAFRRLFSEPVGWTRFRRKIGSGCRWSVPGQVGGSPLALQLGQSYSIPLAARPSGAKAARGRGLRGQGLTSVSPYSAARKFRSSLKPRRQHGLGSHPYDNPDGRLHRGGGAGHVPAHGAHEHGLIGIEARCRSGWRCRRQPGAGRDERPPRTLLDSQNLSTSRTAWAVSPPTRPIS